MPSRSESDDLAVVTSDLHLAPSAWLSRPQLTGDSYYALCQIVELARELRVPAIIAAGDLINVRRPDPLTIGLLRSQLDVCEKYGVEFLYVQGQHELAAPPWLQAAHGWPTWLASDSRKTEPYALAGYGVSGLDYQPPDRLGEALKTLPEASDIVVLHQLWREFAPPPMTSDGSLEDVPSCRLIVTGDYHQHLMHSVSKTCLALSPGSTCLQSIDEEIEKRVFIVNRRLEVRSETLRCRPVWRSRVLDTEENLEKFLDKIEEKLELFAQQAASLPAELRLPIVRMSFSTDLSQAQQRAQAKIGDRAVLFVKPIWPEEEVNSLTRSMRDVALAAGHEGALGLLLGESESKVYQMAQRLVRLREPWQELAAMREEYKLDRSS